MLVCRSGKDLVRFALGLRSTGGDMARRRALPGLSAGLGQVQAFCWIDAGIGSDRTHSPSASSRCRVGQLSHEHCSMLRTAITVRWKPCCAGITTRSRRFPTFGSGLLHSLAYSTRLPS